MDKQGGVVVLCQEKRIRTQYSQYTSEEYHIVVGLPYWDLLSTSRYACVLSAHFSTCAYNGESICMHLYKCATAQKPIYFD